MQNIKQTITLYTTLGCHLCDEAIIMAAQIIAEQNFNITIEPIDIINNNKLFNKYSHSIPVFCHNNGDELSYPFTRERLADWLKSA